MEYVTHAGESVPAVGLGTWQMDVATPRTAVTTSPDRGDDPHYEAFGPLCQRLGLG
ncbi:MAG: hypothetical protein ACQEQY_09835 [Halobacteriota archaeon]